VYTAKMHSKNNEWFIMHVTKGALIIFSLKMHQKRTLGAHSVSQTP